MRALLCVVALTIAGGCSKPERVDAHSPVQERTAPVSPPPLHDLVTEHREELGLTVAEERAVRAIADDARVELDGYHAAIDQRRSELAALLAEEHPNRDAVNRSIDALGVAEARLRRGEIRVLIDIRERLTPAQREALVGFAQASAGNHPTPPPPAAGAPPPPPSPGGDLSLGSPTISDGAALPASLRCQRDGGSDSSPPLQWSDPPAGTGSFAIAMFHYPMDTTPGLDAPSQYWLVWNIPPDVRALSQGNIERVGVLGSDKDGVHAGYTPPCSPGASGTHTYTIRLYALSEAPTAALGTVDDVNVDWRAFTAAVAPLTLSSADLHFTN